MTNYWELARTLLPLSNCLKRRYACVIVQGGQVIATGYNKSLTGCKFCAREGIESNTGDYEGCKSVHAEWATLIGADGRLLNGAELYLVCDKDPDPVPCHICRRMLDFAGVRVVREVEKVKKCGHCCNWMIATKCKRESNGVMVHAGMVACDKYMEELWFTKLREERGARNVK